VIHRQIHEDAAAQDAVVQDAVVDRLPLRKDFAHLKVERGRRDRYAGLHRLLARPSKERELDVVGVEAEDKFGVVDRNELVGPGDPHHAAVVDVVALAPRFDAETCIS